ncbi:hypothetical protein [Streptomyces sp. enrichment culture]|uniref:hypothetical protein n=1 Tax=Streptomyces sp. enrichment culture TaxID=1795815 RepID=UPI003F56C6A3
MVTSTHEASHRIFQDHPEVLAPIFEALGLPPPAKAVIEPVTPDTTEIKPLERRVDTVLKVEPSDGDGFLLAIEAQTRKAGTGDVQRDRAQRERRSRRHTGAAGSRNAVVRP